MLGDLNTILDGLTELEEKGVETIDCRRAQFSEKEPIVRLRVICQSWKVMFQAEYSSGQPLRMLVDLRASVEHALGRGKASEVDAKAEAKAKAEVKAPVAKAVPSAKPVAKPVPAAKAPLAKPAASTPAAKPVVAGKPTPVAAKPGASAAAAGASKAAGKAPTAPSAAGRKANPAAANSESAEPDSAAPEFEVSGTPGWDEDSGSQPGKKK